MCNSEVSRKPLLAVYAERTEQRANEGATRPKRNSASQGQCSSNASGERAARHPGGNSQGTASANPRSTRGSTRLNSSHQIISYAVFCLKKKKIKKKKKKNHQRKKL